MKAGILPSNNIVRRLREIQMKRPLPVYIFTILTSLVVAGVLALATLSKDVYLDLFGLWYWYTTIVLLTAWIVSMVGVFYLRSWAVIASVIVLLTHQIVLVFAGVWSLSRFPMLVVPVAFFVWLHFTKRLTIRLSKDALKRAA